MSLWFFSLDRFDQLEGSFKGTGPRRFGKKKDFLHESLLF